MVCFDSPQFLPVYLCANVGPQGLLAVALPALFHNLPPCWVHQLPPCRNPLRPGCQSPPLLPVWMNVSSLSPWLSGFHTVDFVSSSCFLFLNCCPSFGCVRRHSVSICASILARSRLTQNLMQIHCSIHSVSVNAMAT